MSELKRILELARNDEGDITQYTSKDSRQIYGSTKMSTRKNVQNLFNSENRFPKVLVAQSRVGRGRLNLHKACPHLILFHQEWNPGVVEQQIGRVDRINSFWEKKLLEWEDKGRPDGAPKINIYSIVFEGTYDEHQSLVINERSRSLKVQLFGGILSEENLEVVHCEKFKSDVKGMHQVFVQPVFLQSRRENTKNSGEFTFEPLCKCFVWLQFS